MVVAFLWPAMWPMAVRSAADRGHVCEGGVAEVVGAEVLGLVLRAEHLAHGLEKNSAVLEAGKDEALIRVDFVERAARTGRQRNSAGVARLVDVLRDLERVVSALVVLRHLEPPHRSDAKARIPDDGEKRRDGVASSGCPFW